MRQSDGDQCCGLEALTEDPIRGAKKGETYCDMDVIMEFDEVSSMNSHSRSPKGGIRGADFKLEERIGRLIKTGKRIIPSVMLLHAVPDGHQGS